MTNSPSSKRDHAGICAALSLAASAFCFPGKASASAGDVANIAALETSLALSHVHTQENSAWGDELRVPPRHRFVANDEQSAKLVSMSMSTLPDTPKKLGTREILDKYGFDGISALLSFVSTSSFNLDIAGNKVAVKVSPQRDGGTVTFKLRF